MLLNLILTNLTNIITLPSANSDVLVGYAESASLILMLLVVLSLVLTFHPNGTTVHKVLGLLLVSIFVVFLWMVKTQFVFIYVVYIMAFISAVLMLFLSVVLMLPISTLTSKNYATDSKLTGRNLFPIVVLTDISVSYDGLIQVILVLVLIFPLFIIVGILSRVRRAQVFITWSEWSRSLGDPRVGSRLYYGALARAVRDLTDHMMKVDIATMRPILKLISSYGQLRNGSHEGLLVWFRTAWNLVGLVVYSLVLSYIALPTYVIRSLLDFSGIAKWFASLTLSGFRRLCLIEPIVQTYLYVGVGASLVALLAAKQYYVEPNALQSGVSLGLSQIKELLYGSYSYFLIFSTVVLLVSLLGAAVMTRNKR